jgi:uncharacterized protein
MILSISSEYYDIINRFSHSYTRRIILESISLFLSLWPYLVVGILITSLIKIYFSKNQISGFFQNKKNSSIILASLIGVVSPLGSYIVIPLSAALFLLGTPLPVLMAFLISSPLIDPNLFILTAGAFGYEMAVARVIAAFLLGIGAGYLTKWFIILKFINIEKAINENNISGSNSNFSAIIKPSFKLFGIELLKMAKYISKYFFLAILLAAIIKILTPTDLLTRLFSKNLFMSVLISTGAGVPFYVCGGAAIPVVQQLAELGMSKGAVLAFFISGPITKISNLLLMQAAFNTRIFIFYLITGIAGAVAFGAIYNTF